MFQRWNHLRPDRGSTSVFRTPVVLAGMMVLLAFWLSALFQPLRIPVVSRGAAVASSVSWSRPASWGSPPPTLNSQVGELLLEGGCLKWQDREPDWGGVLGNLRHLRISTITPVQPAPGLKLVPHASRMSGGMDIVFGSGLSSVSYTTRSYSMPLWPLPVAWVALWAIGLRRKRGKAIAGDPSTTQGKGIHLKASAPAIMN